MSEKVTKSVLKVRVEELAGGYVLYQVLEQDKILDGINYKNVFSNILPVISSEDNYIQGTKQSQNLQPFYSDKVNKQAILQRFREILDWEGFQKSDKELEIKMFVTDSGEYLFRLETKDDCKKLLRYKLWYEGNKTYFKIIYCDESLRNKIVKYATKAIEHDNFFTTPYIFSDAIMLTTQDKNFDNNISRIESIHSKTPSEIAEIVKEALEKEFCKPSTNLVEFKETSPNIYEILVTEV